MLGRTLFVHTLDNMQEFTEDQFELFKEEAERAVKRLGLISWGRTYLFVDGDPLTSSAYLDVDHEGKIAVFNLVKQYPKMFGVNPDEEVKKLARHEVAHLLLSRFSFLANQRAASKDDMLYEEEAIVRILEEII